MSSNLSDTVQLNRRADPIIDAPERPTADRLLRPNQVVDAGHPLVEPMATFAPRLEQVSVRPDRELDLSAFQAFAPAQVVSHRQFQTTETVSQGGRGTCWACARSASCCGSWPIV
jgi:hypothetical protein